jgi:hypothetical protein
MAPAGAPRKLICVCGFAVALSGAGEAKMWVPGSCAERSGELSAHGGEAATAVEPEPMSRLAESVARAAIAQPSTATPRMMRT